jgi:hypothetical protein
MSEKHFVCQGAVCECNFGTAPDKLKVLTQSKRYINDEEGTTKLMATHKDTGLTFEKNTFGQCKLQPTSSGFKPCIPALTQWQGFYEKVKLEDNGGNPLLEDSMGVCTISGSPCIKISFHGQTAELVQQNLDNAREEVLAELFPFVNLKALKKGHHKKP